MQVVPFTPDHNKLKIGILIKETALDEVPLRSYYVDPLGRLGIHADQLVAIGTRYDGNNKVKAIDGKAFAEKILRVCTSLKLDTLLVADTNYYKFLTKLVKTTSKIGAVEKCAFPGFTDINVLLSINYQALFYNDRLKFNLDESLKALANFKGQGQTEIGTNIIKDASYPKSITAIRNELRNLHRYGALTCDIETFSLRFNEAGIATIAFGKDQHTGVAFDVSHTNKNYTQTILRMLREFFVSYKGHLIFHNLLFDVKILVYVLFMDNPKDYMGMHAGLQIFKTAHCSQVLTYIATNSTGGNKLGLKENALEYAGDYAQDDIKDVTKIPIDPLLEYNLIDSLATWYLINKYDDVLADPALQNFYKIIGQPSLIPTVKMMLIGLPMNIEKVLYAETKLRKISNEARERLSQSFYVLETGKIINQLACDAANLKLKVLVKTVNQFNIEFNPASPNHIRILLHNILQLPITHRTKTKKPSTKAKVLKIHKNKLMKAGSKFNFSQVNVLQALIEISSVDIILDNFIKNFKKLAFYKEPGEPWLNGNLKTTGTQGLRYSSSDPNMQNMPSTSQWAKLIKNCFEAPPGWVIGSADFASLEDRINAILTQDPNKIKVYTDGFDGHSLRAYAYFKSEMPDITPDVSSINSIANKYPDQRQRSKIPTFALTYEGTWYTLVQNLGLSKSDARRIEDEYHDLYKVSDKFSQKNIKEAAKVGYVNLAFGAKLRTPILRKTIINSKQTPYEAEKEGRSANNAITQSWGVLTNRAVIEFEERLAKRPDLIPFVLICNVIHDAIYLLWKKDAEITKWINDNLIECMRWNNHPAIKSKDVPMEAVLDMGPSLGKQITIPNRASKNEIEARLNDAIFT